jgi:hypothetical protein
MQEIICEVFEGLCNRINAIASAMATGRPVHLWWAVNEHCPIPFERVFKQTFGMHVTNEEVDDYRYARLPNHLCWFYPQNLDGLPFDEFKRRMRVAYRQILEGLAVEAWEKPIGPALGVAYRHHLLDTDTFAHFWECLEIVVSRLGVHHLHVAADLLEMKEKIVGLLQARGKAVATNTYPLMGHDRDRSPANVLGMCADLRSLAGCGLGVLANSTRSSVVDSLQGFGVEAIYTMDDKWHRYNGRDHLFEKPVWRY